MSFKERLSGRVRFQGKVLFLLIAVLTLYSFGAFAATVIDFSNTTGYGQDPDTVMIENIRVDMEVVNPFDPTHPDIFSVYYNVPFVFDYTNLHLVPNVDDSTVVDEDTSCADLEVRVSDASSGVPMSGVSVTVGNAIAVSDTDGIASFTGLVSGSAQVSGSAVGYDSGNVSLTLTCDSDNYTGLALNPEEGEEGAIEAGEVRVVLTWGQNPRDLDSHMTGPNADSDGTLTDTDNRFWVYYAHRSEPDVAALDVDDTSSFGPETITLMPPDGSSVLRPGLYRYSVYHFSGTADISTSSASVKLYVGNNEYSYTPPTGSGGVRSLWTVFELGVNDRGAITVYPINTFSSGYTARSAVPVSTRTGYGSVETGIDFSSLPQK